MIFFSMHRLWRAALAAGAFWLLVLTGHALAVPAPQPAADAVVMEVYVRNGCPHCAAAKAFLPGFLARHPGLTVRVHEVDRDPAARQALLELSQRAGIWPPGVPTFVVAGQVLVGFESPERTGAALAALLQQAPAAAPAYESGLFGTLSVARLGLPLFTLAMGLLDGFNPCAMWVLLFLLSLLVHLQDRKRMAVIAGTFVVASGVVYYAFMAAWLNFFLLVGFSDLVRIALAVTALLFAAINIKDFFALGSGPSLSIPDSAKPGLYARMRKVLQVHSLLPALAGVLVLAFAVNFIELLCTAGLPAIYTAVLAQQDLSPAAHYAYLGLYIVGYLFDDTLMVATAVFALSSRKLTDQTGRWLKLLSGGVMLALGVVMLAWPELLSGG